jgi:hypothetical protein
MRDGTSSICLITLAWSYSISSLLFGVWCAQVLDYLQSLQDESTGFIVGCCFGAAWSVHSSLPVAASLLDSLVSCLPQICLQRCPSVSNAHTHIHTYTHRHRHRPSTHPNCWPHASSDTWIATPSCYGPVPWSPTTQAGCQSAVLVLPEGTHCVIRLRAHLISSPRGLTLVVVVILQAPRQSVREHLCSRSHCRHDVAMSLACGPPASVASARMSMVGCGCLVGWLVDWVVGAGKCPCDITRHGAGARRPSVLQGAPRAIPHESPAAVGQPGTALCLLVNNRALVVACANRRKQ